MAIVITEESDGDEFLRRERILNEAIAIGQKWREMDQATRDIVSDVDTELGEFLYELEGLVP